MNTQKIYTLITTVVLLIGGFSIFYNLNKSSSETNEKAEVIYTAQTCIAEKKSDLQIFFAKELPVLVLYEEKNVWFVNGELVENSATEIQSMYYTAEIEYANGNCKCLDVFFYK